MLDLEGFRMISEDRLLFSLVSLHYNGRFIPIIKDLLTQELDWNYVVGKAIHNRIIPIINHTLHILAPKELLPQIPQEVLNKIQELNYAFIGHTIVFHEEANKILESLDEASMKFMPIKGVLLDQTVYPNKHLRYFSDIDLLFQSHTELQRAESILLQLGYTFVFSNARETVYRKIRHDQSIHCDMHRSLTLFNFFEYPLIRGLWSTASEALVSGVQVRIPSQEYQILILCLHSFLHGAFSLLDLSDAIHIFSKYPPIDWQFLSSQMQEYPCSLGLPLSLIAQIFDEYFDKPSPHNININFPKRIKRLSSKVVEGSEQHSLGDLQYPIPYQIFCKQCNEFRSCPLFSYINERIRLQEEHTPRIRDFIPLGYYEFLVIITMIRKKYGLLYALQCLGKELKGLFAYSKRLLA
jgi:hypothetical protein